MYDHQTALAGIAASMMLAGTAFAGSASEGFRWLSDNEEVYREGALWNDFIGDGKDRYKSAGLTQSWVIPERRLSNERWVEGNTSALELQIRGFVATPDNTQVGGNPGDRPFVQYASIGGHFRTIERPVRAGSQTTVSNESRVGVEIGYQGEPLPFLEIMEAVHGQNAVLVNAQNTVDGEVLVNLEARRTLRVHVQLDESDLQFAPFAQISAGMRENSGRIGADLIYGGNLAGTTWNHDPAIGTMMPGASMPTNDFRWAVWAGGDIGLIGTDAFLDGGFDGDGPSVKKERVTTRARLGFLIGQGPFALAYTATWLSPEFSNQIAAQIVGAVTVKYNF